MRRILYITGLYDRQEYAQEERVEAFNAVKDEAEKHDLSITVMTVINNSNPDFRSRFEELHRRKARFDYLIDDVGQKDYWIDFPAKLEAFVIDPKTGEKTPAEDFENFKGGLLGPKMYDIYRLLGEIFNDAFGYADGHGYDFVSIQSGDQILPKEQPHVLTDFIDKHAKLGMVNGLITFDNSRKELLIDGKVRTAYQPMLWLEKPEENNWLYAHLMEMEWCEVHRIGTGGSMIPRPVFQQFRFHTVFNGQGEDLRFCNEIREKGWKIYCVPSLWIRNRYKSGELY